MVRFVAEMIKAQRDALMIETNTLLQFAMKGKKETYMSVRDATRRRLTESKVDLQSGQINREVRRILTAKSTKRVVIDAAFFNPMIHWPSSRMCAIRPMEDVRQQDEMNGG
jgi:hypothetical protein